MDDKDILQHLLEIEGQAAALVDDAQAEADRRVKAAEEQNRLAYDQSYQVLIAGLNKEYRKASEDVKTEYNKLIDQYRTSLKGMPMQNERFSGLAYSLLVDGK